MPLIAPLSRSRGSVGGPDSLGLREVFVVLWWLGNIVLIFVVAPVCLLFLNRVLRPAKEIYTYADDILDHGVKLTGTLDSVPKLYQTRDLTAAARNSASRYGAALQRIL
jgi:hypothetical protein